MQYLSLSDALRKILKPHIRLLFFSNLRGYSRSHESLFHRKWLSSLILAILEWLTIPTRSTSQRFGYSFVDLLSLAPRRKTASAFGITEPSTAVIASIDVSASFANHGFNVQQTLVRHIGFQPIKSRRFELRRFCICVVPHNFGSPGEIRTLNAQLRAPVPKTGGWTNPPAGPHRTKLWRTGSDFNRRTSRVAICRVKHFATGSLVPVEGFQPPSKSS